MLQYLLAADNPLGRINQCMLPDAMLLELMLSSSSDETKRTFQKDDGEYDDVVNWVGVILGAEGRVTELNFSFVGLRGLSPLTLFRLMFSAFK